MHVRSDWISMADVLHTCCCLFQWLVGPGRPPWSAYGPSMVPHLHALVELLAGLCQPQSMYGMNCLWARIDNTYLTLIMLKLLWRLQKIYSQSESCIGFGFTQVDEINSGTKIQCTWCLSYITNTMPADALATLGVNAKQAWHWPPKSCNIRPPAPEE